MIEAGIDTVGEVLGVAAITGGIYLKIDVFRCAG
jgi:hypothetical protein